MEKSERPDAERTTDPGPQPGRADQSTYLPELDKFSPEPGEGDEPDPQATDTPDIEPISGPVHTDEKIEEAAAAP